MGWLRRRAESAAPTEPDLPAGAFELDAPTLFGDELLAADTLEVSPVAVGVFDALTDYGDRVARGDTGRLGERVRAGHPLLVFGESFWTQMTATVLLWRADDLPHRDTALALIADRRPGRLAKNDRQPMSSELYRLMVCLPEYLFVTRDEFYDSGLQDVRGHLVRELAENIADTCDAAAAWARTVQLDELERSAAASADAVRYL